MKANIPENLTLVVILDVSGIYAQIYNQGYFDNNAIDAIKQRYSDPTHWQVVVIE